MLKNAKKKYFELWADTEAQNLFLKVMLVFMLVLTLSLLIATVTLSLKDPYIISINDANSNILPITQNQTEIQLNLEINRAIRRFIQVRHNWESKSFKKSLKKASSLVLPSWRKSFFRASGRQLKETENKKIKQRFYISDSIAIDLSKNIALIRGDRILIVNGFRATQPMTFKLEYSFSKRTSSNPEGIYIKNESLVSSIRQ